MAGNICDAIGIVYPLNFEIHLLAIDGMFRRIMNFEFDNLKATGCSHIHHVMGSVVIFFNWLSAHDAVCLVKNGVILPNASWSKPIAVVANPKVITAFD